MVEIVWKTLDISAVLWKTKGIRHKGEQGGIIMLKQWEEMQCPADTELEERLREVREKLKVQQLKVKEHRLPVLVLVEGWGTAGKGSLIGQMIKNIDPRFFKVASMSAPTEEQKRKPILYPHFVKIPWAGKLSTLDSG